MSEAILALNAGFDQSEMLPLRERQWQRGSLLYRGRIEGMRYSVPTKVSASFACWINCSSRTSRVMRQASRIR